MIKINDTLLSLYKEYETLIRDRGMDPKDYESSLDEMSSARLGSCRFFRNYLSHRDDPSFLVASDAQIKFLQKTIEQLKSGQDTLKKHLKNAAAGACSPKDKCIDVIAKMAKLGPTHVLVISETGYALADIYDIALQASQGKTIKMDTVKTQTKGLIFASPKDLMSDLPTNEIIVCTKNGTAKDEFVGVYYPKK